MRNDLMELLISMWPLVILVVAALLVTPLVAAMRWGEKRFPIEPAQPRASVRADYKLAALNVLSILLLGPLTGGCAAMIVNAAGGGIFVLRADGWWFILALVVYVLATDIVAYLFHRAQHTVPALWAMHSLHHSAETMTLITGARHFWIEQLLLAAFLPVVAILFRAPATVIGVAAFFYFLFDACVHVNIRIPFGRFGLIVNNPQYHRIHHSMRPDHQNKNFCKLLPLLDLIFGTAYVPAQNEFPSTGLGTGETASGWLDGLIWPFRRLLRWHVPCTPRRAVTAEYD
jgi:sterol desaturase/sphingolipid hydroxylase (fatty acid hydroxylase superfamily)